MAFYYFDTSALVKYYVTEPGSTWVRQVIEELNLETGRPSHVILVAEITRVEVAAGLAVIERIGRIGRTARNREYGRFSSHLAHRYAIVPLSTDDWVGDFFDDEFGLRKVLLIGHRRVLLEARYSEK